ncbi:hypothetical protein GCM10023238_20260 [Streptomyces heliomycini]
MRSQAVASAFVLLDECVHLPRQRLGHALVDAGALHPQRRARPGGPGADPHTAPAADQGTGIAVGQPADLLDRAQHAGTGVGPVDAWHQQHPGLPRGRPGGGLGGLHRGAHLGIAQVQRNHHPGQHDLVVERQYRQGERCGLSSHDLPFGSQVELCRLNAAEPPNVPEDAFALSDHRPGAPKPPAAA